MADDPGRLLRIAQDELDNVQRAFGKHAAACTQRDCAVCASLATHVGRCQQQVDILAPAAELAAQDDLFSSA